MPKRTKKQLAESLPLVAIELGSHSIRAMAAQKVGVDMLRVLGYEQSQQYPCVDRGVVVQSANAGYMISNVLKLLANRIHEPELPAAFVLLGGASMQVVPVHAKRDLLHKRPITENIINDMKRECKTKIETHNKGISVLDLIPAYFIIDGQEQEEQPTSSQTATLLESHYIAFVGKQELDTKVQASFDRAAKTIEHSFIRPDALFSAFEIEDPDVLDRGCAILDMGAQTTTLSIFKGNQYLHVKVVPLGGAHITRAIQNQGLTYENAEKVKIEYGYATPYLVEQDEVIHISDGTPVHGPWQMSIKDLAQIIQQKIDEIVDPLMDKLNEYSTRICRLYITGGASMLQGMPEYLSEKTSIEVLYGSHAGLLDRQTPDEYCSPEYASLVGALMLGSDYRDMHPGQLINPPTIERGGVQQTIIDIFTAQ